MLEMMGTDIPQECGTHINAMELVVSLLFFVFLLICIECIFQAHDNTNW
jgi:hypothetical protein